jgi:alpha-D-ribose 1-methylphosphonate 5-triphosphate diphosphatase
VGGRDLALVGGRVLRPDSDEPTEATVLVGGGRIKAVDDPTNGATVEGGQAFGDGVDVLDVTGRLVLPGIVDLHGDAFERCLLPRPGVPIGVDLALADNDAQLLAAGITTAYLSATDSWEPGLRSRETLRQLVDGLGRRTGGPDVRLHVRHERCNVDGHDELVGLLEARQIAMLSYNDHTNDDGDLSMTQLQRTGLSADDLGGLQAERARQRQVGADQERELAEVARRVGCPTASHDPDRKEHLQRDLDLGVAIAEFPTSIDLAAAYRNEGIPVLLGAPNLVRGGSHLGNLSVADALAAGVGDILCSDYHYPSLLQAPFVAAAGGVLAFGPAWRQVSTAPARAAGLDDRGRIETGQRADVVIVAPPADDRPAIVEYVLTGGHRSDLRP